MKMSNAFWVVSGAGVCFLVGWILPSPLVDIMRCTSGAGKRTEARVLQIFIDHDTGCEYVGPRNGALAPRTGADGKQLCEHAPVERL
ncbi:hypothetical protein [Paraburkholderia adhaesiva]|uniref:hypothetical protein n=1 Tax=Paraburkholderia adhaesiva TaxID=2883244 RepID=UPI001F2EECC6|nr:hypothetical protein [Paraburkholderia adhaesiva]